MKRLNLGQLVAQAMDMFNRDFASENAFWDEENFTVNFIAYYAKLVNDEYADKKSQNKNESGFSIVELSSSWVIEERAKVKKDDANRNYLETESPVFEFTFDAMSSSVHSLRPVGECLCEDEDLLRISNKDFWKYKRLPPSCNIYWYSLFGRIYLLSSVKLPDAFDVAFLPSITMESTCAVIPEPYITVIITTILNQMFGAKNENKVLDTTVDGNPNTIEQTELNSDNFKQ